MVDTNRWSRVSKYFETALSMPPESHAAFLERVCADDQTLRAELESLLRASDASGAFLEQPLDSAPEASPTSALLPVGALLGH